MTLKEALKKVESEITDVEAFSIVSEAASRAATLEHINDLGRIEKIKAQNQFFTLRDKIRKLV